MKLIEPKIPPTVDFNNPEVLLAIIATLAHHLSTELDLHYEYDEGLMLTDELESIEAASAALFLNGLLATDPVHHVLGHFVR